MNDKPLRARLQEKRAEAEQDTIWLISIVGILLSVIVFILIQIHI